MRNKSKPVVINKESKGYLAKLLATENISIQHKKVKTAYFDVRTESYVFQSGRIWGMMLLIY